MRVALITPWKNAWVPYFAQCVNSRGHEFGVYEKSAPENSDVVIHGWAIGSPSVPGARNIVFLRRYELFDGGLSRINWRHTNALICVNSWFKEVAQRFLAGRKIDVPVHMIYNGLDLGRWTFKQRTHGKRIGMACHIHPKKNLPLAAQILGALPQDYELHVAGQVQDPCTAEYLNDIAKGMKRRLYFYGQIPSDHLDFWWEQMNYCLSTSISEGNPNNVIEAMAKGIKPVVHRWPGADDQFAELFNTVDQAVDMISEGSYDSAAYRDEVRRKFSLANIERVLDIALEEKQLEAA